MDRPQTNKLQASFAIQSVPRPQQAPEQLSGKQYVGTPDPPTALKQQYLNSQDYVVRSVGKSHHKLGQQAPPSVNSQAQASAQTATLQAGQPRP